VFSNWLVKKQGIYWDDLHPMKKSISADFFHWSGYNLIGGFLCIGKSNTIFAWEIQYSMNQRKIFAFTHHWPQNLEHLDMLGISKPS